MVNVDWTTGSARQLCLRESLNSRTSHGTAVLLVSSHPPETGAERWLAPGGQEGLEFHPGQPGQKGEKGKSHWHRLRRGPNGKLKKEKEHLPPGKEIEVNTNPIVGPPEPVNIWQHIDWGEVRRRTEIVIIVVGIIAVTVSTAGTGSTAAVAGGGKLILRLKGG